MTANFCKINIALITKMLYNIYITRNTKLTGSEYVHYVGFTS